MQQSPTAAPQTEALTPPQQLRETCRRVYAAIAAHAFDEAVAWPSQKTIATETGLSRKTVNHAVRDLVKAGWLVKTKDRGRKWDYCRYELHAEYKVSPLAARQITRRAHRRRALAEAFGAVPDGEGDTNTYGVRTGPVEWCSCWACRPLPKQRGIVLPDEGWRRDDWRAAEGRRILQTGREALRQADFDREFNREFPPVRPPRWWA